MSNAIAEEFSRRRFATARLYGGPMTFASNNSEGTSKAPETPDAVYLYSTVQFISCIVHVHPVGIYCVYSNQ